MNFINKYIFISAASLLMAAGTVCAQQQSSSSSSSVVRKGSADARKKADSSSPNVTERMQQFFEEPERSDADAQWMKIVYRQLDLEKVKNAPLYYPGNCSESSCACLPTAT